MLPAPESSPFALTEHVFATNIAGHSLLFWTANGLVLVGVGAAIVWGTRAMIGKALGRNSRLSSVQTGPRYAMAA